MNCPHFASPKTTQLVEKTSLGYCTFRCSQFGRKPNERTETPFNHLQFPTGVVLLVDLWRLRYKLGLRDLAEMFLVHGFELPNEVVRNWNATFAPLITEQVCSKRRGKLGAHGTLMKLT